MVKTFSSVFTKWSIHYLKASMNKIRSGISLLEISSSFILLSTICIFSIPAWKKQTKNKIKS